MPETTTLGETIAAAREAKRMSREALADQVTRSTQSVALWESNHHVPPTTVLMKLETILGVDLRDAEGS